MIKVSSIPTGCTYPRLKAREDQTAMSPSGSGLDTVYVYLGRSILPLAVASSIFILSLSDSAGTPSSIVLWFPVTFTLSLIRLSFVYQESQSKIRLRWS